MGLGDWFGWIARAPETASSSPEPSVVFSSDIPTPVDDYIAAQQTDSDFEAPVTKKKALSADAVLRGRNLLCSFSTLPMVVRNKQGKRVENALLDQIDPNTPNVVVLAGTIEDLVFEGYAWWRVTGWDANGFPASAEKLDPNTVTMNPPADHAKGLRTLPSEQKLPVGTVYVEGIPTPVRDALGRPVLIRFDSPNPGVLRAAARAIRHLLLLQNSGIKYADNTRAQEYFRPSDDTSDPLEDEEIKDLLDNWKKQRKLRQTAYVPAAIKLEQVEVMSPVELQLIDILRNAVVGVANAMGLDPEDLGVSTTSRTYQNGVDRRQDRINDVFSPYMSAIKDRLSMNDVSRRGHKVSFVLDDYLKADPKTRWECYQIAIQIGAMSIAEVRDMENLDPDPELERAAKAKQQAGTAVPAVSPQDQLAQRRNRVVASAPVPAASFSAEDEHETITFALDDDEAACFSTDLENRTITGLMVPWGKVAQASYAKWRFSKGSLKWGDVSRIKLNMDHDRTKAVGYAKKLWETDKGLMGTFKITTHPSGDEALLLASERVKDGFSIETAFPQGAASWTMSEVGDDFVRDVQSGQLVGCAQTAAPSFDDARLTSVKASRTNEGKDGPMPEENKPTGGVGTLEMSAEVSAAFSQAIATGMASALEQQDARFSDAVQALIDAQQKPAAVNPGPGVQQFHVTEAPVYRFDGIRGEHDFSSDLVAAHKNQDHEALKRAQTFIAENFSNRELNKRVAQLAADFAVTTTNVASLNPNINRPDMYVDQLQYPTPIWDAIKKGAIADNTPFVLPKFNTSSGLVADHVQGTEPTPGALTTTSQTITPTAVSGKVEVTREAWDQGGNPQLSTILWRQMVRAWDEALEQGAAALLEGLSVTAITLPVAGVNDVLVDAVTGAIVDLHFIRGGFRFQDFFLEKGLYKRLSQAKDGDGRKLLPILGPQNADGSAGPLMASLNVAGLAGRPAWALPYVADAPNDSYIFNREDVHGWASAPQRLDFEYRVAFVDIAIWGYKAFACTRTDGVRKFIYDETA